MNETDTVTKQLVALRHMTIDELREKFSELFGVETSSFNPQQIRKRLAYRIQEVYYGGLTEPEKAILKSIAEKDPLAKLEQSRARSIESIRGTRFSREWHGKIYEVVVTDNGAYEYDGRLFRSLSAIAKEITGTQWNGKLFFGVKEDRRGR